MERVAQVLSSRFHLDLPQDVSAALSTMRSKVNRMKHEEGVQAEEFVSADDYATAVAAIERFWGFLEKNEAGFSPLTIDLAGRNTPPAGTNSDAERPTAWLGW
jgi:hypothetical protein